MFRVYIDRKLTKEEIESALSQVNGDLKSAAKVLNVKYPTFYYHVKRLGVKFAHKKPVIDISKIEELYQKYQSLSLVV